MPRRRTARSSSTARAAPAAPAFAPDQPVAFARSDGPALHGLFRTDGRRGPISEAVASLWRAGNAADAGTRGAATEPFFPRSTPPPSEAEPAEPAPATAAAAPSADVPL